MPGCGGGELLRHIRREAPEAPVVVYEPRGAASGAAGYGDAFLHISEPMTAQELGDVLLNAITHQTPKRGEYLTFPVGSSSAIQEVVEVVQLVGNRRCTVLVTGETGTGKEVVARALHTASKRSGKFVAVNCAALPDNLLETELFGHTKGAFTGAVNARVGLFEQAHRGTILLDEIGDMPFPLQSKLLRVLQEREVQRIGSSVAIPVDVRVIAASNTNLVEAVAAGRFRRDLYYRLNVVALRMPTLRERVADIPDLSEYFLRKIAELESAQPKQLSAAALEALMGYSWPGNVRQLEHALEAAVALSGNRMLLEPGDFDFPREIATPGFGGLAALDVPESGINFEELIMGIERRLLERALQKSGGNKARAADMLRMKRTTLISKFKSLEAFA
ncbi:MAG TPA: sigma-54 dependent transcriptional regulator [Bryobacteraceae bacterium]|nr:sigma-54 dependent transcriptional regulator [Bryobacteraceae bacterium]